MPGGVDNLIYDADLVARVCRVVAKEIAADYPNQARLLDRCVQRLQNRSLDALAPPEDASGVKTYLDHLVNGLGLTYTYITPAATKWLVRRLRESRLLVRSLLKSAQITGDADIIGAAQRWLEKVEKGPGENVVSEPVEGGSTNG